MPSERKTDDRKSGLTGLAEQHVLQLQAAGRNESTLIHYRRVLSHFRSFITHTIGSEDVRDITRACLQSYADHVEDFHACRQYKTAWLSLINRFFDTMIQSGSILANPARPLQLKIKRGVRHPRYLGAQEMANLLDSISTQNDEGLRDRAMLELLYSTGLRSCEVCRLNLSDINFADRTVCVNAGKGNKDRIVPIGKVALAHIDRYIADLRGLNLSSPLFYNLYSGKPLKVWHIKAIAQKYRKKLTARAFRHSFAVALLSGGASIRHIQEMLGHADLKNTQIYTRIVPAELKRVHRAAHPSERNRKQLASANPGCLLHYRKKGYDRS